MEIPDQLHCLFAGTVEAQDDAYVVEVPQHEVQHGDIQDGEIYRIALLPTRSPEGPEQLEKETQSDRDPLDPPIEEGDQRTVEIEDIGDQGDGITRVERGFVVIVPETDQGERVTIEIADVRENVAFADVVERVDYYE
jgi:predicted RNA-binding protein with TRAM domain